jgi:hypothetical protein
MRAKAAPVQVRPCSARTFASLREIFLPPLAICLEGVNMVLRTFRYGFY